MLQKGGVIDDCAIVGLVLYGDMWQLGEQQGMMYKTGKTVYVYSSCRASRSGSHARTDDH